MRHRILASPLAYAALVVGLAVPALALAQPDSSATSFVRLPEATLAAQPVLPPALAPPTGTRVPEQPRAVEYSDWYGRRLTVHRWASYAMLPLFAAQYVLGDRILDQKVDVYRGVGDGVDPDTRRLHQVTAGAVGGLFTLNTVTGLWNLYDARRDPAGRRQRTVHALSMLAADAGFVVTGFVAAQTASDRGPPEARTHRNIALGSMAIATAGAALMWFGRDE
jgi:hypothetical protein